MTTIYATQVTESRSTCGNHASSEHRGKSSIADRFASADAGIQNLEVTRQPIFLTLIKHFFQRLVTRINNRRQQKIDRDAFSHMMALSDEQLDDIGVTRNNVRWAASLPIEVDAALALSEVTQGASRVMYR